VQATLLLAGWGLQSGGGGPDPWLVTGHCARLAHRLGLHRVTGTVPNAGGAHESAATEKTWAQWRTWLAWYQ
jgi:trimethylamine:corrinoid methyltransferase-like protein